MNETRLHKQKYEAVPEEMKTLKIKQEVQSWLFEEFYWRLSHLNHSLKIYQMWNLTWFGSFSKEIFISKIHLQEISDIIILFNIID